MGVCVRVYVDGRSMDAGRVGVDVDAVAGVV
jgi:hypothetical protein